MFFYLVERFLPALEAHDLGFLRVFTFVTFQSTIAILLGFLLVVTLGPRVIEWLRRQKIGDRPEFDQAEINALMEGKKGTPTMGGLIIIFSIALTTVLVADLENFYVQMALVCLIWLGGVGAVDDWLKLTAARRGGSRQGLTGLEKLMFQIGLAVILSVFTYNYGRNLPPAVHFYFPFFKDYALPLGLVSFVLIGTAVLVGTSNAVNLTDGLDGLASGCMAIVSFTFFVLSLIVGIRELAGYLLLPHIEQGGQMAVIAGSMTGACLGFLWFNCNPARVFMGDTGSLALGGLIGYIAIVIRQELMLFLVGGIFVAEALSVMLQVGYFKYTRKRFGEGRRIFLMSTACIGAMLAVMALVTVKLR